MDTLSQWYGIMPNTVLYDKKLTDKQKLLYCTISSLCAEKWYCRATNEKIWEMLDAAKSTISKNISELEKQWYINVSVDQNYKRTITLCKNEQGDTQKWAGGDTQKWADNNTSFKSTKEKEIEELKQKLEIEYQLPQSVIELAIVFDKYKAGKKIRKFDKGQLTRRVNKLKKDGLDCEEGMLMTLEKSIASWYQWTTPIRERELKKKEEKPNTLVYH